ncbi:hypothetical protein KHA80_09000 [Anaerobacillus sp. HL2]|nr:hypothetical protein KHA80_09000 [Anaerobacillus sp. HL2]
MMFAAKDFGNLYVQFEGINLEQIGPYQIKELQVIPNYMNFYNNQLKAVPKVNQSVFNDIM